MGPWARKHRRKIIGGVAAVGALVATIVAVVGPGSNPVPAPDRDMRLQIHNTQDIGALPDRDKWCTLVRNAEHCWLLQEAAGNAIDTGATGGWDLTPAGAPRRAVVSGLPVLHGAEVDFTAETGTWADQANGVYLVDAAMASTAESVSVTVVFNSVRGAQDGGLFIYSGGGPYWYANLSAVNGKIYMGANGTAARSINSTGVYDDGAWYCATLVFSQTVGGAKLFVNGAEDTLSGNLDTGGSWAGAGYFRLLALGNVAKTLNGGEVRARLDVDVSLTLAQHQALCGSLWQPPDRGTTRITPGDATWTQTGGARCYPTSASAAICVPGGLVPYGYDATLAGMAIPVEPDSTNRIPFSTAIDCVNWTCTDSGTLSVTTGQVAPDGSATATLLTLGAWGSDDIGISAAGYSNSTTVYPKIWVKCSSGAIRLSTPAGTGRWTIDCSCVGGTWNLLNSASHACIAELTPWETSVGGTSGVKMSANAGTVTAQVWAPTLTEQAGTGVMTIPTAASAVSTGTPAWAVDNTSGKYYRAGSGVTQTLTTVSGTCWVVDGDTLRLSGAVASECSGFWGALEIRR